MLNFAHFNPKNTHISTCKNVQIYTTALQMNSNHAYMHGYYSCANDFFILFFSLLYQTISLPLRLQQPVASPTSTTTQHGRIRRRKKKITAKPSTNTKHRNLAQKINPKSTEKQLENPTQNQSKLTRKPNLKIVQTHCKTQPKSYSTENSRKKPNGAESATRFAAVGSSIATTGSSIVFVGWGWEVKGRWWRREGGVKERVGAKVRGRPNRQRAKPMAIAG